MDMTSTVANSAFTDESFESLLETRNDPDWLIDLRRSAWEMFQQSDWPERRSEEWSRTDIRAFKLANYQPFSASESTDEVPADVLGAGVESSGGTLAGQCISVNGRTIKQSLSEKWAKKGVIFGSLDEVAQQHSELLKEHLMQRAFNVGYDRFSMLHTAWMNSGAVLYVPRGVTVDEPFHVMSTLDDGSVDMTHLLVVIEDGAEATFMSECRSREGDASGFHCGGIELVQGAGSNLRFVNLQDWGDKVWHFSHQKAIVERDSNLQWTIGALGGKLAKVNQHVELVGPGATSQVNGTMFAERNQQLTYNTLQHHVAPNCRSDFLYKTALQDRARTVWSGMIKVDKNAQKTDGYQRNDNLLLSDRARADSIPGLEILADDVRCTHGSTSGRVDEELIFYACSRGFTRNEAIRLVVTGFFQQIFDRVTIESVREALGEAIARRVRDYV